jgi:hypothetical protein
MFVIRVEQYEAFERHAMLEFERKALAHFRSELAELTEDQPDAALIARVRHCLRRAATYGLESEQEVLSFVDASYLVDDESFDSNPEHPWARAILNDPGMKPEAKAEELLDRAFAEHQASAG